MNTQSLKGRVAIVTGGANGLGREIALRLAQEGVDVGIMSLSKEQVQLHPGELKYFPPIKEIEETQQEIEATGVRCIALDGDVTDVTDLEKMVNLSVRKFGRLDILVNNAATNCFHPVLDHNDEAWKRVINVNLIGAYLGVRVALPHLKANGWGRIVSIASTNAHIGSAGYSAYSASKHALLGFTRSLALEVAAHNITANTISPGFIEGKVGEMHIRKRAANLGVSYETMRESEMEDYPRNQWILPREIADLNCYLCRDEAGAINGEDIRITSGASW